MAQLYIPTGYGMALIRFSLSGDAEEMAVTLGIKDDASEGDPGELASEVYDALTDTGSLLPTAGNIVTGYTLNGVTVRLETGGGTLVGSHDVPIVGTASGSPIPQNCAYLIQKKTGLGGRSNHGRMFLPPVIYQESDVSAAGLLDATDVADTNVNLATFVASLITNEVSPYLFHYPTGGDPTPDPTAITALVLQQRIATQRRRLRP